jgi:hypothetical protein
MEAITVMMQAACDASTGQDLQNHVMNMGALALSAIVGTVAIVSFLGILYMTMVVAPNATQRFSVALRERNVASFFAGIPILGFFAVTTAILQKAQLLVAVNLLIFGVIAVLAYAAAAEDIGRRLFWACGKEGSRASHLAGGWLVFAFAACFPVLGWFVILPYVTLSGLGSVVVGMLPAKKGAAGEIKDIEFPEK